MKFEQFQTPEGHILRADGLQFREVRELSEDEYREIRAYLRHTVYEIIFWVLVTPVACALIVGVGAVDLIEHGSEPARILGVVGLILTITVLPGFALLMIRDAVQALRWLRDVEPGETLGVFAPGEHSVEQGFADGFSEGDDVPRLLEVRAQDRSILFVESKLADEKRAVELRPLALPPRQPALFSIPEEWELKLDEVFGVELDDVQWTNAMRRPMSESEIEELTAFREHRQAFPWKAALGWSLFIPWSVLVVVNFLFEPPGTAALGLFIILAGLTLFLIDRAHRSTNAHIEEDIASSSIIRADVIDRTGLSVDLPESSQQVELLAELLALWTIDGVPAPWREQSVAEEPAVRI